MRTTNSRKRRRRSAKKASTSRRRSRITDQRAEYQARGVFYLPEEARFQHLLNLPESEDIARAINDAMRAIEAENRQLDGVLPKTYSRLDKRTLIELLRAMAQIPMEIEGDAFGKIYEYFLGNFAMAEGQRGGEFFTPTSLVKLIVEILQPFQGRRFWTQHAVPAVCLFRVPSLSITTGEMGTIRLAFTERSGLRRRFGSAR